MTRNNIRKVLGQTICRKQVNLFHSFPVVGTTKWSSNNNYSTKANKGNFINIPKQLHNNKLMNNVVPPDFRNYSSSSVNSNNNTIHVLNPVQYKRWSKEEVCSLLYSPKENGGAGLNIENVKLLYDAGFKGTSISNIVTHIQYKDKYFAAEHVKQNRDYQSISQTTLETVVNWVDNVRKTRLYHLWSKKEEKEQLILAGVNETEVELLFDSGFAMADILANNNLELVEKFEKYKDFSKIVNWINSVRQPIEVTWVDFKLLTLKHHGFEKLDAFSVKFEDFGNGSWLVSTRENETKQIFSNVKEIQTACDEFIKFGKLFFRGRPSIEVLGQVRTGKTFTASTILPRALADAINEDRMNNNQPKLMMAPTFYIRFDGESNPLDSIYKGLQKLRDVIGAKQTTPHPDTSQIIDSYENFITKFPEVHVFIVLDEVQLLQPAHLNVLREFVKNTRYNKVTFILAGSTQGRFIRVLDKANKSGLSYQEATVNYTVPINNSKDLIDDTLEFHKKNLTQDDLLFINATFGCLNCATISQIIVIMTRGSDFTRAIGKLVEEIFKIFDRDILIFSEKDLSPEMLSLLLDGSFTDKAINDPFYKEYIRYFVDRVEKKDSNGNFSHYLYQFKDKLLLTYLQLRNINRVPDSISHHLIMEPLFRFGERINQCRNNQYPTSKANIQAFLTTNPFINNLADSDIDHMYKQVYKLNAQSNTNVHVRAQLTPNSTKIEKLEEIFILIRQIASHPVENRPITTKQVYDEMVLHWFKSDPIPFYSFIHQILGECNVGLLV